MRLITVALCTAGACFVAVNYLTRLLGLTNQGAWALISERLPMALLLLFAVPLLRAGYLQCKVSLLIQLIILAGTLLPLVLLLTAVAYAPIKSTLGLIPACVEGKSKKLPLSVLLPGFAAVSTVESILFVEKELFLYSPLHLEVAYLLAYAIAVVELSALSSKSNLLWLRNIGPALITIAGLAGFASGLALWL